MLSLKLDVDADRLSVCQAAWTELLTFRRARALVCMEQSDAHLHDVQRLFLQCSNRLRGFILGLLPDRAVADDVLQEVFLIVTAKAAEFQSGTDFLAWVRAIARLKVMEHRHRRFPAARQLTDEAWDALVESAREVDDAWDARREALRKCLDELAPRAREVVQLRYSVERLDLEEVARRMSWTVGSVKVALSRAKDALWDCVQRRLTDTKGAAT
jgi:RNA polymerase sigma-70 factor (ECF subfamily)